MLEPLLESVDAVPLQLPAPQLDAPVDAVLSVDAVPLHDDAPAPPLVELVDDAVVDALPEPLLPPPQAARPRSAVAATASEVFMFLFMSGLSPLKVLSPASRRFPCRGGASYFAPRAC